MELTCQGLRVIITAAAAGIGRTITDSLLRGGTENFGPGVERGWAYRNVAYLAGEIRDWQLV